MRATVRTAGATTLIVAVAVLSGCGRDDNSNGAQPAADTPARASSSAPAVSATARPGAISPLKNGPTGPAHQDPTSRPSAAVPVKLRIPAIHVRSSLQRLHLDRNGTLQTPSQWQVAGWYAGGVRPGDVGPAVIAGHVDSTAGPAVFFSLRQLRPGDAIYVDRADGTTARFRVAAKEYPKRRFPTHAVYGPAAVLTLRLVTCTGDFDASRHSYVDNLVVTAYLG